MVLTAASKATVSPESHQRQWGPTPSGHGPSGRNGGEISQVMVPLLAIRNGLRNYGSSAIPAKEMSDVPKDADGKGPGTELISLQTSGIEDNLSACRTSHFEELLE